jgi:AcrR family transcriptional regulator
MSRAVLSADEIGALRDGYSGPPRGCSPTRAIDAVTMCAIGLAVGCSPMTSYRYFRDKDENLALVRAATFGRFADDQEATAAPVANPVARLDVLADAYVRFALADPEAYQVMFKLHQDTTSDQPELLAEGARAWKPIRRAARDAIDAGALAGDTDSVAHRFWAALHGLVIPHLAGKPKLGRSVEELLAAMKAPLRAGNFSARRAEEESR